MEKQLGNIIEAGVMQGIDGYIILGRPGILYIPLRVQVPNNHRHSQNQYYNDYYPNPKYLIIGSIDP